MSETTTRRRFRHCAETFGISGEYNPSCCRWPKSCSPYPYAEAIAAGNVTEDDLEPELPARGTPITDRTGEDDDTFAALLARVEAADEVDPVADMREEYGVTCDCLGPPFYACEHWPALGVLRGES